MTPLCFIDTETTGVHPDRRVWEVAIIRRDDRGEFATAMFVDVPLDAADPFGLKVGGFYERHPMGQWFAGHGQTTRPGYGAVATEAQAAENVVRWTHGAHLVGAVPNFDADCLDRMLRRHGLIPAWHYHLIDVEAMAVGYLEAMRLHGVGENGSAADPVRPPWRSNDLALACGVEPPSDDERHTALGDARWAMRWYDAMTGGTA